MQVRWKGRLRVMTSRGAHVTRCPSAQRGASSLPGAARPPRLPRCPRDTSHSTCERTKLIEFLFPEAWWLRYSWRGCCICNSPMTTHSRQTARLTKLRLLCVQIIPNRHSKTRLDINLHFSRMEYRLKGSVLLQENRVAYIFIFPAIIYWQNTHFSDCQN